MWGHWCPRDLQGACFGSWGCPAAVVTYDHQRLTTYACISEAHVIHASGKETGVKEDMCGSYVEYLMPSRLAASLVGVPGCHIKALNLQ